MQAGAGRSRQKQQEVQVTVQNQKPCCYDNSSQDQHSALARSMLGKQWHASLNSFFCNGLEIGLQQLNACSKEQLVLQPSPHSLGMPRGESSVCLQQLLICANRGGIARQHALTVPLEVLRRLLLVCSLFSFRAAAEDSSLCIISASLTTCMTVGYPKP